MSERVAHTLAPWADDESRVLILGTMPSPKSRARGMYYGHPQNRFWRTLAALWQEEAPAGPEAAREFALRHHIALWDVLASCDIDGAADASISAPVANDIAAFLDAHPTIHTIFTTGKKADALYRQLVLPQTRRTPQNLPSSSAANRGWWPDEKLAGAYAIVRAAAEKEAGDESL
ncbi:MAG: DNA-deoxyinosine glycosylase [Peptococcaceae bacterium]|nr:DNA-deoxyinosine glycosylase [Peptococcaceae bacterium]